MGLYYLEMDSTSPMYGMITFFMVSSRTQLEASLYNLTSKTFTSTHYVNITGTMTVNRVFFKNNTLLYMYGYDNSVGSQ